MLGDPIPASWRERIALRHLQCGDPKSDSGFPAGVGRETLDSLEAQGLATKQPDLAHGGFIFTISRQGQIAIAGVSHRFRSPKPVPSHSLTA